ncbi:hypothetical protein F5X98DRAFT_296531 [Xylaria grammica]|nr:hypothetical protein F5X98DRAFT_296531 [Xylaria grammica]
MMMCVYLCVYCSIQASARTTLRNAGYIKILRLSLGCAGLCWLVGLLACRLACLDSRKILGVFSLLTKAKDQTPKCHFP